MKHRRRPPMATLVTRDGFVKRVPVTLPFPPSIRAMVLDDVRNFLRCGGRSRRYEEVNWTR